MTDLVTVKTFSSRIEAEMAKGLLATNKISSIIFADDAGGMRPFPMSYVSGAQLKVSQKDLTKAKKILNH